MYLNTKGLVLRETAYKETSKILTVLTPDEGRITVTAKGARRRGSKTAAATQLLAFSDMTLFRGNGGWTLTEARSIEMFEGLRSDLELLTLGSYFAQLLETVSESDFFNPEILSVGLNALYAAGEAGKRQEIVKSAFELRLMCLSGFEPAIDVCRICGRQDAVCPSFDVDGGMIRCRDCGPVPAGRELPLDAGALDAMRYICSCPAKKLFSFSLGEDSLKKLSRAAEEFVCAQLDRSFGALDFYKELRGADK